MIKAARLVLLATIILGGLLSFQVRSVQAAPIPISGEITSDTVWTSANVYYVTGSVTVLSNVTLTIDPGTVVKFTPNTRLIILGKFTAAGTRENNIIFTSYRDDSTGSDDDGEPSSGSPGDWGWIEFAPSSGHNGNILFADIRYGGYSDQIIPYTTGNILVSDSSPIIQLSNIASSAGDGVFVQSGTPDIAYPTLAANHFTANTGACINLNLTTHFLLSGNSCFGNGTNGVSMSGRTFTGYTIWDQADLPYYITSDIIVANESSLTIAKNMVLKFNPSVRLVIDGKLQVNGEAGHPVTFTSSRDDAITGNTDGGAAHSGAPGDWGWIEFGPTSDPTSSISYASISYGGFAAGSGKGNLFMNGPGLSVDHSLITNSSNDGIYANTGPLLTLTCNNIQDNAGLGLRNMIPANSIQAANQYWGSPNGPYHSSNPDGPGNGVSDGVIFTPWLTTPCGSPLAPVINSAAFYDLEIGIVFISVADDITDLFLERSLDGSSGWTEIMSYADREVALVLDHQVICSAPYFYRARGFNQLTALFSNYSNTISSKTLPCKPSNFSASEFNLNWKDNSPDESNFVIDVSTDSGTTWVEEAFLPANTQFYQVNRFFCGTRQYRVRAYRQSDERYSSNIDPVTIDQPTCRVHYLPWIGR